MARSCEQNHRRYTVIRNDIAPKARRFFALISSKPMEIVFFFVSIFTLCNYSESNLGVGKFTKKTQFQD